MALKTKSLFLYGFAIDQFNSSLDFVAAMSGPTIMATLNTGFYSLGSLMDELVRAMNAADADNVYSYTIDRTIAGGLENRVTIATNGTYLSLLFGSGPRVASSVSPLIGFNAVDYTGATSYTSSASAGTVLITEREPYSYIGPNMTRKVQGSVNISASGLKEAIVFSIQTFLEFEVQQEPEMKVIIEWQPFIDWMIQQRLFEFTPEYNVPNTFYEVTLEKSGYDGQGLGLQMTEMLPDFPFYYKTGKMTLRQKG